MSEKVGYFKKFNRLFLKTKEINLVNLVDRVTDVYGDKTAFILEEPVDYPFLKTDTITYNQVQDYVKRLASSMKALGVARGDRVAVYTSNRIEMGFIHLACMRIAAIPVPLNFMFKAGEVSYIVEDSGAKVLITDNKAFNSNLGSTDKVPKIDQWLFLETPDQIPEGAKSLIELMANADLEDSSVEPHEPQDVAEILYTSGTTGFPKGAMLTSRGVIHGLGNALKLSGLLPNIKTASTVASLPLAHIMGMRVFFNMLVAGIPWHFFKRFDPVKMLEAIQDRRPTTFVGVPTMYSQMYKAGAENYDLKSIKLWVSAADALPVPIREAFTAMSKKGRMWPLFVEVYGQVETNGITCIKVAFPWMKYSHGAVGIPITGIKVRIVDEDGNEVKRGDSGELEIKGPTTLKGYWNKPEIDKEIFHDGWFRTGDLVRKGRYKLFYFVDRKSERIKCGGYSIFSKEVEQEMIGNRKIDEVGVVGKPDEMKGEVPVAILTLKEGEHATEDELLDWARENIAHYKCPREIKIIASMPHGMTMKMKKKQLLEEIEAKSS